MLIEELNIHYLNESEFCNNHLSSHLCDALSAKKIHSTKKLLQTQLNVMLSIASTGLQKVARLQ